MPFSEKEYFEDYLFEKRMPLPEKDREPVARCSWCGLPIYSDELYFNDTGDTYYCSFCLDEGTHKGKDKEL